MLARTCSLLGSIALFGFVSQGGGVTIERLQPYSFAYLEFKGALFRFADFHEQSLELKDELKRQSLERHVREPLLIVLFSSPTDDREEPTIWGLGYEVPESLAVSEPLKLARFPYEQVARTVHKGTFGTRYNVMLPWLEDADYEVVGPQVLRVRELPPRDRPDEFSAEFVIPVRKRLPGNSR